MLEIRPTCEHCNKNLPNGSKEAMICNFECTFCADCVDTILYNVCPNCGGDFTQRPTRPSKFLTKYPVSTKVIHKPVDFDNFSKLLAKYKDVDPNGR